jgi:hypothetical protein
MKRIGNNGLAILLGIGLVLFPIHFKFQPLKEFLFLPALGFMLIALVVATVLARNQLSLKDMGSRWIWIPMMVIVFSFASRLVLYPNKDSLAALLMGISLFGVYLTARVLGRVILKPFITTTAVVALSAVIFGILITPGNITGGLISNYCASAGFMILGFFASQGKWQKYLIILVGLGLFFTGAAEALFAVFILGIIVLIRHDYSKKLFVTLAVVLILGGSWYVFGSGEKLYMEAGDNIAAAADIVTGDISRYGGLYGAIDMALTDRQELAMDAIKDLSLFGHGYTITNYEGRTVHNVPLIIIDQIGIAAGLAWLVVTLYCLIKTKWKYLWLSVLILSVFDHYTWTQFAPWWWAFVGITTVTTIDDDFVFRSKDASLPLN